MRNVQSERIANETLGTVSVSSERISLSGPHMFPEGLYDARLHVAHVQTAFCSYKTFNFDFFDPMCRYSVISQPICSDYY